MSKVVLFTMTIAVLGIAVYYDLRFCRIPNWLTFPAMGAGLFYGLWIGGLSGLLWSLSGLIVGCAVFFGFYLLGGIGAGDVKLMAAAGSLFGPKDILYAAVYTAIAGGIYATLLLVTQKRNKDTLARWILMMKSFVFTRHFDYIPKAESEKTTPLRYGVAIAVGTLVVLVQRII